MQQQAGAPTWPTHAASAKLMVVMVIYSALVRSHQSTSLVASASCIPRGYTTRAQPCLKNEP